MEEHGAANGIRMVVELAKWHDLDIEHAPESTRVLSRDQIKELRKELVKMYPRLDNPLDRRLPYKAVDDKRERGQNGEEEALL